MAGVCAATGGQADQTNATSAALATALGEHELPAEVAKIGLRTLASTGRERAELAAALNRAGGLDGEPVELSGQELDRMVAAVQERGDAARGQRLYRKLECAQCHAIAGSGGAVGPDLTSIGGSAQIDY